MKWVVSPDWMRTRLQRRFAVLAGLLITGLSLLFLILLGVMFRSYMLQEHARASMQINQLFQATLENAMVKRDLDGLQAILDDLGAQEGIAAVRIVNREGEVRFSSDPGLLTTTLDDPDFAAALAQGRQQTGFHELAGGGRALRSINPVPNQARCMDCHGPVSEFPINGLLVVDYRADDLRAALWRGSALLGGLGVVMLAAVLGGAWLALRRLVLARLARLEQASQAIEAGDLGARSPVEGRDELARLGRRFNAMAAKLEGNLDALETSRRFLQSLIDAIPDGVRVIGPDHRMLLVNRAYCAQLGVDRATALAQPCHRSSHGRATPCPPGMLRCPLVELLENDAPSVKCSHTHVASGGTDLSVEVVAVRAEILIDDRLTPCVVESIRDLETQFSVSQEQRLAEMGVLAAGVAHEVQNPLASIQLVLDALAHQQLTDDGRDYLEIARSEIGKCHSVTESLLRLAAAPSGDRARRRELVDLGALAADTTRLLSFECMRSGVELSLHRAGDTLLRGSDSDLRMLIFNLTHNAIHAMPQGGPVEVICQGDGESVVLTVRDRGVGIAARDRDRVMTPFWTRRADGTRGRGLGLSICKGVVDAMGGEIGFVARPGGGTEFNVRLSAGHDAIPCEGGAAS